jgi:ABC-type dipeptide/oligopeptide/nickel transport system ATPase subunit
MSGKGIRIEGLSKRYGDGDTAVFALKDVNMHVAPGEVVGLIGPSGFRQEHAAQMSGCGDRTDRRSHDAGR